MEPQPETPTNPLEPTAKLVKPLPDNTERQTQPQATRFPEDSAVTKAEKFERHAPNATEESSAKRRKLDSVTSDEARFLNDAKSQASPEESAPTQSERQKGVAPIKAEYIVHPVGSRHDRGAAVQHDDDAAEGAAHADTRDSRDKGAGQKKREKAKGMNSSRGFGDSRDEVGLCSTRMKSPEFSPEECRFGDKCKFEHDLRKYLKEYKREDLTTFDGVCPVWSTHGKCDWGWACRFVGSHMTERDAADGRKELILTVNDVPTAQDANETVNEVSGQSKNDLMKRRTKTPKADAYSTWIDLNGREVEKETSRAARLRRGERDEAANPTADTLTADPSQDQGVSDKQEAIQDERAQFTDPPFLPSEKRKIYFGPETPVLAPLTTQGNLPFRRLCTTLGAQITYSEMAMSMPLIQGTKPEWALMRAHVSETHPPAYSSVSSASSVVKGYDNSQDSRFGAQIAANKPWQALKATEILTQLCPSLRVIDLNCGCPIDLVYRQGAGSALLDSQGKLERILRGMNAVSGSVPITVKIRMGTKNDKPTALKLVDRLVYGGQEAAEMGMGPCGVAAITLHGRSRQQRYTKNADWSYIADCAALIKQYNEKGDTLADTIREPDARHQANGKVYFLGNGDCYSHEDYTRHLRDAKVDGVMIARGALIKPWIFEEIASGQYLDKSATERLSLVEKYAKFGLETWGSDERGVGTTRRFLLEWLSFAYRYVPVGILERLPPNLQDRPPAWRGRNELETLLGSDNYLDWIKISEMFLGPAHKDFRFQPKHKSNSYEIEAEG